MPWASLISLELKTLTAFLLVLAYKKENLPQPAKFASNLLGWHFSHAFGFLHFCKDVCHAGLIRWSLPSGLGVFHLLPQDCLLLMAHTPVSQPAHITACEKSAEALPLSICAS